MAGEWFRVGRVQGNGGYEALIAQREAAMLARRDGVNPGPMGEHLFGFQATATEWALRRGRAAIFAATGLGKTLMELEWARQVGGPILLLAPLAVGSQILREAERFEVPARTVADGSELADGVNIANYERLHRFDPDGLMGLILDESSILKAFDGRTRRDLTLFGERVPMRLCATATPAPNDHDELGQHAEFLGVLTAREMLALYFTQDGNTTNKWRLKGHAREPFWRWVASWALAFNGPADIGHEEEQGRFDLPPLQVRPVVVDTEDQHAIGTLFRAEASTLIERREARRRTLPERVAATAALVAAEPAEPWLLWCDLNAESAALTKAIPGAVEVKGSDSSEHKERALLGFAEGSVRVLVSKPSICGHGLNFQRCARMVFVGLSDSFERYYQAVRRCWRYGQTRAVDAYVVTAAVEGAVARNIERKERQMEEMMRELVANVGRTAEHLDRTPREQDLAEGDGWRMMLGDCVERLSELEEGSVGLSVFSPPFPSMYVYTDDPRDMGNVADVETMIEQFSYLIPELLRVLMPGRSVAIHLAQAQTRKRDGQEIGLRDFRGATIDAMTAGGFTYYGEATIDKALRNGTPVLTPDGWVPVEDVGVGLSVVGANGMPTAVAARHPQGERDLYRVAFSDGTHIDCCGDHLWTTRTLGARSTGGPWLTLTTESLAGETMTPSGRRRYEVPLVEPIDGEDVDLPLDGYTLGALLGDGAFTQNAVSICAREHTIAVADLPDGHEWRRYKGTDRAAGAVAVYGIACERDLGLHGRRAWEKHVPVRYLFAGAATRLAVLRGLMDTDGRITMRGGADFRVTSQQLAEDVVYLVRSLGGVARISEVGESVYDYLGERRVGRQQWRVSLNLGMCPFTLPAKAERWKPTRRMPHREITSVEFIGRGEATCISVAAADGLFVCDNVTVTHNCPQVKAVRTKDRGLLFKTLAKDSAHMRMAQADYLLQFRKPGENPRPIRAGQSERYENPDGWITPEEWIEWAAPVWYRASEGYPGGIRETDTLNVSAAREGKDERHLCPLQLGVIERAVKLWTAPGEIVCSPFAGVGSEGVGALRLKRRFVGVELKRSYFDTARANLAAAAASVDQTTLFAAADG